MMVMGGKRRALFWVIGGLVFIVVGFFMPSIIRMTFIMIGGIWAVTGLMLIWFSRGQSGGGDPGTPPGAGGWVR
jgi:hypothetical protein